MGSLAQLGLLIALWPAGLLFCGTLFFTALLFIPLLAQSVLYPEITVTDDGLLLRPMVWRAQFVPRASIAGIAANPFIRDNPALGRLLHGRNYRPREGMVVLVNGSARLLPFYRLIAPLVGGNTLRAPYGFALSNRAQANYAALARVISAWLDG